MKNSIALLFAILLLTSCSDEYLAPEPQRDDLNKDIVFGDILLAEQVLNNAYGEIPSGLDAGLYGYGMLGCASDDGVNSFTWAGTWPVTNGAWTASNTFDNRWGRLYRAIRKANIFIESIDVVPGNESLKTRMKAEARYLRAFFYHELVRRYGGVPLILTVLSPDDDLALPRNTMQECVDFIVSECDAVKNILPVVYEGPDLGRATKGTAMALKSRMLLYYASPLHNPGNDKQRWTKAAAAAKELIDAGTYELYPDYQELFLVPFNQEIIFARPDYGNTFFDNWQRPSGNVNGGWGGTNPTVNFIETYDMSNGKPIEAEGSGYNPDQPLDNRDNRMHQTVVLPFDQWKGDIYKSWENGDDSRTPQPGAGKAGDGSWTGFNLKKFGQENFQNNTRTWPVFRLGEILLNYAEAINESEGPTDAVYETLDRIRARKTVELPPMDRGLSQDEMRERIHDERRVELAFEEHRWFDVRRWKKGEVLGGPMYRYKMTLVDENTLEFEKAVFQNRAFDPGRMYLYPIPQSEVNKNENLEQNPGW